MALDDRYIVGIELGEYFVDKLTGLPLTNGTIEFFKDKSRSQGKIVYELAGDASSYSYTSLPNPLTLSAVGTIENASNVNIAVYYFPYDSNGDIELYYIVVKDSAGVEQFTRQAWPNVTPSNNPIQETDGIVTNELGNPQFVDVYFNPLASHTYNFTTVSAEFPIGPDWDLIVTGTGTEFVKVSRGNLAGSLNIPNGPNSPQIVNAPYDLVFTPSSGVTSMKLRQRLNANAGLFSGGYLSGYLVAKSQTSNNITVALEYQESDSISVKTIVSSSVVSNVEYTEIKGTVLLDPSSNPQSGSDGYVDILVNMPTGQTTRITSVQVVGMNQDATPASYDQEPSNRQEDHTWHNYKNSVLIQAKDSILTGWQFGVNPWQFRSPAVAPSGTVAVGSGFAAYTADQTVIVEQNTNMLKVGRSSGTNHVSTYTIQPDTGVQGKFALVNFIDNSTARPYWGYLMSALVRARLSTSLGTNIKFKVDLIYSDTPPSAINPIATWGNPVSYTPQWTRVSCNPDNTYSFDTNNGFGGSLASLPEYTFDKFSLPIADTTALGVAKYLAIVVYTVDGFLGVSDSLAFEDISLIPNDFGMVANPKTFDQTLQECQYYYENSFSVGTFSGASLNGAEMFPMKTVFVVGGFNIINMYVTAHAFKFNTIKRSTPTMTYFAANTGMSGNVSAGIRQGPAYYGGSGSLTDQVITLFWDKTTSTKGVTFNSNTSSIIRTANSIAGESDQGVIIYNWVADARL